MKRTTSWYMVLTLVLVFVAGWGNESAWAQVPCEFFLHYEAPDDILNQELPAPAVPGVVKTINQGDVAEWISDPVTNVFCFSGFGRVYLYSVPKNPIKEGAVTVSIWDRTNNVDYLIGRATMILDPWCPSGDWEEKEFFFVPSGNKTDPITGYPFYRLEVGHQLVLELEVGRTLSQAIEFAYDSTNHPARIFFASSDCADILPPGPCGDCDPTNELNISLELSNSVLHLTDAGGTLSADLSAIEENPTNELQDLSSVLTQGNDAGGSNIVNLADPMAAQDAATKAYVDAHQDADADPTNELITDIQLVGGTNLVITEPGRTNTVNLGPVGGDDDWVIDGNDMYSGVSGNVGIGTQNPMAKLDISSTNSGFLPPRMSAVQRNNISLPPAGSVIYNTDEAELNYYDGTSWHSVGKIVGFGSWQIKSVETTYPPAATDGFVVAIGTTYEGAGNPLMDVLTPHSSKKANLNCDNAPYARSNGGTLTVPVRKGDTWRVDVQHLQYTQVYWIPLQ